MFRCSQAATFAVLSILWCGVSASAETLRCQSVNGNVNCAGSGGVSCQTVNGKKVCVSGHGDVVQSFGNANSTGDDEGLDATPPEPPDATPPNPKMQRRMQRNHKLLLERDGQQLHLRTDWLSVDRDQ